jgi:hypothetical protein
MDSKNGGIRTKMDKNFVTSFLSKGRMYEGTKN